jgi:hypothetical protein
LPYVTHPSYVIQSRQLRRHSAHCTALHRAPQFIPSSGLHGWMGRHATYQMRAAPEAWTARVRAAADGTDEMLGRVAVAGVIRHVSTAARASSIITTLRWSAADGVVGVGHTVGYPPAVPFCESLPAHNVQRTSALAPHCGAPAAALHCVVRRDWHGSRLTCVCSGSGRAFQKALALWAWVPGLGTRGAWVPRCAPSVSSAGPERSGIGPRKAETYPLQLRAAPALQG